MTVALSELKKGQSGVVHSIENDVLELKMLEFGFVEGTKVYVIEKAPFGDPLIIESSATRLILRKSETDLIKVTPKVES